MESQGRTSQVQSWRSLFPDLAFTPRAGQKELFRVALREDKHHRLVVLPTGYGKTIAGLGYYVIARELGRVNRCLWFVSSDEQRDQLAPKPEKGTRKRDTTATDRVRSDFGLPCLDTARADGSAASVRMHLEDHAEIFVTTYQTLLHQSPVIADMLSTGEWQIIADEAHHLSVDGQWAAKLAELVRQHTLYMSATPMRTDRRPLKDVPQSADGTTYDAYPEVSLGAAIDEGAIREPLAHAEEWHLRFLNRQGERVEITTSELRDRGVQTDKDFDGYVKARDLRFDEDFLDKMILDTLNCLAAKRGRWPGNHQLVVFAMGNSHAKHLAHNVFSQFDVRVDWVGVWRSEAENKAVIRRFKTGTLDVLVQVGKVGEGFDHHPASIGLWLNLIQSEPAALQELGRIMRAGEGPADVFASTDHVVIKLVQKLEAERDVYRDPEGPRNGGGGGLGEITSIDDIEAEWMHTKLISPDGRVRSFSPDVLRVAQERDMSPEDVEEIVNSVVGPGRRDINGEPSHPVDEVARRELYKDRVNRALSVITGNALALLRRQGSGITKDLPGRIKRNLNQEWFGQPGARRHGEMLSDDFKRKHEWLEAVNRQLIDQDRVPLWMLLR